VNLRGGIIIKVLGNVVVRITFGLERERERDRERERVREKFGER
jgi:hypothetical protein